MIDKVYVLDTNIILQSVNNIAKISDEGKNIIVIPETVLLELEDKKRLFNELGYQARQFARLIASCKVKEVDYRRDFKVVKMVKDHMSIHLMAKDIYDCAIEYNHIKESNDKRIVEIAELARKYYKGQKVVFLSIDIYARIFGLFKNLKTETLHEDRDEVPKFQFVKTLPLDSIYFAGLQNKPVHTYDEDYRPENYCYAFESADGNSAYATVHNETLDLLDESDFNQLSVKPVNLRQKFLSKAILSNLYNIIVVDAKAGSGKTLMSLVTAMRLVDKGLYEKIVYVRNSIESLDKGADVGFLAGNEEKFRIYNMALYDTMEFIAKKRLKKYESREVQEAINTKIDQLVREYNIEKLWPGEARGRTLSGAVVIMDEWQNSSENTTQLILSRLDNSCMAIVIGSNRQIDNIYLNKYNNGLTSLLKQTRRRHDDISMFAIELESAVRGKFAEFSERIFEKKQQ